MNKKFHSKLNELPALGVADAAWVIGIAAEALEQFLSETNHPVDQPITVSELLHTAFHQLGYKQLQSDLLSQQLRASLSREQELTQALQSRLDVSIPASAIQSELPEFPTKSAISSKNKKKKKAKNKMR
ncbi:MAG: hypothetical protein HQL07_13170 [Nitrospirae bacterium]|nr:hypothetical protein [Magnetococcales bacterium]HAT51643.1 hypothetical protein [Alphaproteobacteria bacterium]